MHSSVVTVASEHGTNGPAVTEGGVRCGSGTSRITEPRATGEPDAKNLRFVGLDVHTGAITVVRAEPCGAVRSHWVTGNRAGATRGWLEALGTRNRGGKFERHERRQPV